MSMPRHLAAHPEDSEVAALSSVYLADRADHAASVSSSIALLGAGIAFATATVAFYDQIASTLAPALVALIPFPLWMVALYHALLAGASMCRSVSLRMIQGQVLAQTPIHA